jgi:serine/threonine protein phosphatase 1
MALSRLRNLWTKKESAPASLPAGLRLYAVGDNHGRADLLDELATRIADDVANAPAQAVTVFLGDYVDRGPASAAVVERLSRGDFPTPICALRGNHEEVLLRFLEDETVLESWREFGGLETLHSYGVNVANVMRGQGYDVAQKSFVQRLPEHHERFLRETRLTAAYGDYFFCHAGVRPGVPFDAQSAGDLLWIREEFLRYQGSWEKVVVHGHTPVARPDNRPRRINIDTGAYATSLLTALALEGEERRFLFADGRGLRR